MGGIFGPSAIPGLSLLTQQLEKMLCVVLETVPNGYVMVYMRLWKAKWTLTENS